MTYLDPSEPYAALRLSARNRKRIAAAVAAKPKEAAQPVAPVAPGTKAAAPTPSVFAAHAERAARPFVALAQGSAPKPAATTTAVHAKSDPGNWKAAHARAAGKAVPVDANSDDNHGWAKVMAKINARKGI